VRLLSTSVSAVNSALHRARSTLAKVYHPEQQARMRMEAADRTTDELLQWYVHA
jgi:hypothetical protein